MSGIIPNPIDDARRVGTVTIAAAQWVTINLPNAGALARICTMERRSHAEKSENTSVFHVATVSCWAALPGCNFQNVTVLQLSLESDTLGRSIPLAM